MSGIDDLEPALVHHIVNTLGWPGLRPLQEEAIGPLLAGDDAILLAPTAGGKTDVPDHFRCAIFDSSGNAAASDLPPA
ncbi:hypothetical protein, partial [Streptomyces sp. NPDC000851]